MIATSLTLDANGNPMPQSADPDDSIAATAPGQTVTGKNNANNALFSDGGACTLIGGALDDTFYVDSSQDTVVGNGGVDTVVSWGPEFVLPPDITNLMVQDSSGGFGVGNARNNLLAAEGSGTYTLVAGTGNDVLIGNGSGDPLDTGAGSTRFVIGAGATHDVISNFRPGIDTLQLNSITGITGFAALIAAMTQLGGDVQLSLQGGQTVTLRGTTISQFSDRDFLLPAYLPNYTLAFNDGFKTFTSSPDGSNGWDTTGGADWRTLPSNHEAEYYSDSSVGVNPFADANGVLSITATPGSNALGLPYNSGIITTEKSFGIEYGYIEVSAKLPAGPGLWPAAWLLPTNLSWPPEIDIFEQLGSDPSTIYVGTHSAVGGPNVATTTAVYVGDTSSAFHTYAVDWEPNTITWYFDGNKIFSEQTPADLHQPMYLLFNLAVGGAGSWPGAPTAATQFPASYQINYVRAYASPNTVVQTGPAAVHSTNLVTITGNTTIAGSGGAPPPPPPPPTTGISGHAYADPAGQGKSATGMANVVVQLLNASGAAIAGETAITGADGSFNFSNLAAGSYQVHFGVLPGYGFDAANAHSAVDANGNSGLIVLTAGQTVTNVQASYDQPASIVGTVWYDSNNNGVIDANELGAAGVTVELENAAGAVVASTVTNGGGGYAFRGQLAGSYTLLYLAPAGGGFTKSVSGLSTQLPGSATRGITLAAGQALAGDNAGLLGSSPDARFALSGWGASAHGGTGNFAVTGGGGGASISLGAGNSSVVLNGQSNTINIGAGNQSLVLTGNSQSITLGNGTSTVSIAGDYATVRAGTVTVGTGVLAIGGYDETITAAGGNYIVSGTTGLASITLGNGNSVVTAGGSGNAITVGSGTCFINAGLGQANVVAGGGAATITTGGYNNRLDAGAGINTLHGGLGNDTFVLNGANAGFDTITGFQTGNHDVLDVARTLAGTAVAHDLSNIGLFITAVQSGGNTALLVDPTGGHGTPVTFAVLEGVSTSVQNLLSLGDFSTH